MQEKSIVPSAWGQHDREKLDSLRAAEASSTTVESLNKGDPRFLKAPRSLYDSNRLSEAVIPLLIDRFVDWVVRSCHAQRIRIRYEKWINSDRISNAFSRRSNLSLTSERIIITLWSMITHRNQSNFASSGINMFSQRKMCVSRRSHSFFRRCS